MQKYFVSVLFWEFNSGQNFIEMDKFNRFFRTKDSTKKGDFYKPPLLYSNLISV